MTATIVSLNTAQVKCLWDKLYSDKDFVWIKQEYYSNRDANQRLQRLLGNEEDLWHQALKLVETLRRFLSAFGPDSRPRLRH